MEPDITAADMLLIERPAPGVRLLRLNRPDKRNALATPLLAAIADAIDAAAQDPVVQCAVITGSDRVFAAGADIAELASKNVAAALADPRVGHWQRLRNFPKPLIAAVEGWSLGAGNELAMCCDIVVAGRGAKFGQPETNLGIIPGAGGTATLARLVGRARAMRMVLLGDALSAAEAKEASLVSEIVDDGAALSTALEMAGKIVARAPLAMRQAKALIAATFDTTHTAHLALERQAFAALFGTDDRAEGVAAFLARRTPCWRGQ